VAAATTPAAGTAGVTLCVGVAPLRQSIARGQASQWAVGAWTVGGNVPDVKLQLVSTAGAGGPTFTFGCGAGNGKSVCDLGAVDASSAQRQLEAQVTVPAASAVTAVSLTVTGSAANLALDPAAASSVVVLTPSSPVGANLSPITAPVGVAAPTTTTVSPGGSAAGLFPTVGPGTGSTPVANVSPLGGGTTVGSEVAEVGGLAALGVAMFLAITRLSFRRPATRPAGRHAAAPRAKAPAEREK
jgi:hypothetical protein